MARESERLKLPVPDLLDAVDRDFFELLVLTIDEAAASFEDIEELKEYLAEALERVDKSIQDSMLDHNIITSEGYNGSQPVLDQVLKGIKDHLSRLKVSVDSDKYAKDVVTSKRYGKAKSNNVEAHLQAFDNTMKEIEDTVMNLQSTDIGHGSETVGSTLDGHRVSIKKLEDTIGSGLNADNIKTKRSYQGSERNVEDALRAINAKIDSGNTDTSKIIEEINDLIKDLQGATEAPTHASSVKTLRSYHGGNKDVEDALRAISSKLSATSDNSAKNTEDIARIDKILGGDGDEEEVGLDSDKIKHSSKNIKSNNVKDALEELFIYADDVHSKWASSVGKPLTKGMTASEKESYTKILVQGIINKYRSHGVYVNSLDEISKVDLFNLKFKTNETTLYYPKRGYIYNEILLDFGSDKHMPYSVENTLKSSGRDIPTKSFVRHPSGGKFVVHNDKTSVEDRGPWEQKFNGDGTLKFRFSRIDEDYQEGKIKIAKFDSEEFRAIMKVDHLVVNRREYATYNYDNKTLEEDVILHKPPHPLFGMGSTNLISEASGVKGNINTTGTKKLERPVMVVLTSRQYFTDEGLTCGADRCYLDLKQVQYIRELGPILKRDFDFMARSGIDTSNGVYLYLYSNGDHNHEEKYQDGRVDRYLLDNDMKFLEHKVIRESL